jgi:uncharacterized radical SAM superfamily Fe-S cluster-containing enzyme
MTLRDYTFLGTTRSLCPHCRRLLDATLAAVARSENSLASGPRQP